MSQLPTNQHANTNRILAGLPPSEYLEMMRSMEVVDLNFEETIYGYGQVIDHVYFPLSGIVSMLTAVESEASLEVGLIGREGMVGLAVYAGVAASNVLALVQGRGSALRTTTKEFLTACREDCVLTRILRRFAHSRLAQVSQSAACYRFHPIEERLARWLLMTSDRMETSEFEITQEFLSNMLGVRREAVNKAAVTLEQRNLITHTRGHIAIVSRRRLERATCICYEVIKKEEKSFPVT